MSPSCARMHQWCLAAIPVGYRALRYLSLSPISHFPQPDVGMVVCGFVAISEYCIHRSAGLDLAVHTPAPRSVKPGSFPSAARHLISSKCLLLIVLAKGTELTFYSEVTRVTRFPCHAKLRQHVSGVGRQNSPCGLPSTPHEYHHAATAWRYVAGISPASSTTREEASEMLDGG